MVNHHYPLFQSPFWWVYHIFRPKCHEGRFPKIGLPPNHPCSSICRWNFHFKPSSLLGVGVLWLPLKWAQVSMSLYYIYTHICLRISQTSETVFELGPWLWLPLKWYQMISHMYVIVCINIYIYIYIFYLCVSHVLYLAHIRNTDQATQSRKQQRASGSQGYSSLWNHFVFREGWIGSTSIPSGKLT